MTNSCFSHILIVSDLCPLFAQALLFVSLHVMLRILLSILVFVEGSLFCVCLASVHVWQHSGVVHMPLQGYGNVAVFGAFRLACHVSQ